MEPRPRPRLLVADDARVMRMLLRTWLERLGCDVTEAPTGTEALAAFGSASVRFDAALLDIHMPGLTGLQVLEAVRQDPRWRDTPVIIITTLGHQTDVDRGLKIGATAYLTKPLGFPELMRALERILPHVFGRVALRG